MNGEIAWNQKKNIVFAVDQEPFDDSGKWFCFLYPLMTMDGERLHSQAADFPNTGRVWWMIGDQKPPQVVPGALWSGPIEEHPGWSKSKDNPRHNRFQARKDSIRPGGADLIEMVSLAIEPTPSLVHKGVEVPMSKPPASIVFLQGNEFVLGPLRAHWDPDRLSATFEALVIREFDPNYPVMLHVSREVFEQNARVESFAFEARQLDYAATPIPISIRLTRKAWIKLDALRAASTVVDGLRDKELINWAVKTFEDLQLSRSERRQLNKFLEQAQSIRSPSEEDVYQRRMKRLEEIADEVKRAQNLGPEVADLLGRSAFRELVESHLEVMVEERVSRQIEKRQQEIEEATKEARLLLEQVEQEREKRKKELEEELEETREAHREQLVEQQKELEQRELRLKELKGLLEEAQERFEDKSQALFREWLDLFPALKHIASQPRAFEPLAFGEAPLPLVTPPPVPPVLREGESSDSLLLPAFLTESRHTDLGESLTEDQFLEQFAKVVADEGFLYSSDELRNFHTCIKTGYLTILAGRTGMGKSSLPRLYAKALGCNREFLHLSVRPDWLDDRDLLGAFNAIAHRFEPSPSGFTERLICAQQDWEHKRGGIYLICLDEMNLARVEHYFAQFLSILEKPPPQRVIHLFGQGLVKPTDPYAPFRDIRLLDNIRFIGTVNIDETAFFFSPKVLDRAEVVVFQDPDLASQLPERSKQPTEVIPVTLETFTSWQRTPKEAEKARPFLLEIDRILRRSRLGFGFRQFDRMLTYIASAQGVLDYHKAIDFQLMQVALPRLRRTAPRLQETLDALIEKVDERRYPRSADMLNRIRDAEGEDDFFQLI